MVEEIWKPIRGYDGNYVVSNLGRVGSIARDVDNHTGVIHKPFRILKSRIDLKGYVRVYLSDNKKSKFVSVHRLVAKAFIPNPQNKPQVNHISGIKSQNNVENLEWCTNSENQLHAYKLGLNRVTGRAGRPKRPVLQIDLSTNEVINEYPSIADASRAIGYCNTSNIGSCCRGLRNHVGGYKWIYKTESEVM